jgi:hypothetical protein
VRTLALVVGALVLASLGAGVVGLRRGDAPAPPRPAAAASGSGLRFSAVPGWVPAAARGPELPFRPSVVLAEHASGARLLAALLPADAPSLLPTGLIERMTARPYRPVRVRLGALEAIWYRGLAVRGSSALLDVYVAPTTQGVATIACQADASLTLLLEECRQMASTVALLRGRPLPLRPESAFEQRLPEQIAILDGVRQVARAGLGPASDNGEQAQAAQRLADAYRAAAAVLSPLVPEGRARPRALVEALGATATAYDGVAEGLRAGRRALYARSAREVRAADSRVHRALAPMLAGARGEAR